MWVVYFVVGVVEGDCGIGKGVWCYVVVVFGVWCEFDFIWYGVG